MSMISNKLTLKHVKQISKALTIFLTNYQQRSRCFSPLSPQMQVRDEWLSGGISRWLRSISPLNIFSATYFFLYSSTRSCMLFSSESCDVLSAESESTYFFSWPMYAWKMGSRLVERVLTFICCSSSHLVCNTWFCCSRNRTCHDQKNRTWALDCPASGARGVYMTSSSWAGWQIMPDHAGQSISSLPPHWEGSTDS